MGTGQRYFSWMKITTGSLFKLWERVENDDVPRITPETIGGMPLASWDGDLSE